MKLYCGLEIALIAGLLALARWVWRKLCRTS
jgi:hypothetical protein